MSEIRQKEQKFVPLSIFLCYVDEDKLAVRELYKRLRADGFNPWFDEENLLPGQKRHLQITKTVQESDVILVCISHYSITKTDPIHKQIKDALDIADEHPEETLFIIPVKLVDCATPQSLEELQSVNLYDERGYDQLVRALYEKARQINIPILTPADETPGLFSNDIIDQTAYIEERTQEFVGRQFVFDAIEKFTHSARNGYFMIRGEPGIGKTALSAQLVRQKGYVHHFNIRAEGISSIDKFVRNVCAQLIIRHGLDYTRLDSGATRDGFFFHKLLRDVSNRDNSQKTVIIVDALDEADMTEKPHAVNTLYLPQMVPESVYIVVTMRSYDKRIRLRIDCTQELLDIDTASADNMADIRRYIEWSTTKKGIQDYIRMQGIDNERFIGHLSEKSQGNFMYLRWVLPDIEKGLYKSLNLDALPLGLQNYYRDHWNRMKCLSSEEDWFGYQLPVILALTVTPKPISIDMIARFSGLQQKQDRRYIQAVLQEWSMFLNRESVQFEDELKPKLCYSLYHASFYDFIRGLEEIQDEHVNLDDVEDRMWESQLGLEDE